MSDLQQKLPSFKEVMSDETHNGKLPSFKDVMGDAEPVKKKGFWTSLKSLSGGKVGESETPSTDERPIVKEGTLKGVRYYEAPEVKPVANEIPIDENDPLNSLQSKILSKTVRFGEVKSENGKPKLSVANELAVRNAEKDSDKILPHIAKQSIDYIKQNAFPTSDDARNWIAEKGDDSKNKTTQLAKEVVADNDNVKNVVARNNGDLIKSAIDYAASQPGLEGDQVRVQKGQLGRMDEGRKVWQFLQNKNVKEIFSKTPELQKAYNDQANNFFQHYPEIRTQKLATDIAQGREDYNYNNPFLNLPGVKSANKVAETLYLDGKWSSDDYEFYKKEIAPKIDLPSIAPNKIRIPTPGLIESGLESASTSIADLPQGIGELTGIRNLFTTKAERLRDNIDEDLKAIHPKFKGWNELGHLTGNLGGYILPIGVGSKVIKGANIVKNADRASELMTGLTFYHDIYKEAEKNMPNDPLKARLLAAIQSTIFAKVNKVLPGMSKGLIKEVAPEIKDVLGKMQKGIITGTEGQQVITTTIKDKVLNAAKKLGKIEYNSAKLGLEMGGATLINDAVSGVLTGRYDAEQSLENTGKTIRDMFLGGQLMSAMSLKSNRKVSGEMLYDIASDPSIKPEDLSPAERKNYDYLKSVKETLDGETSLDENQKGQYLLHSLNSNILNEKLKTIPEGDKSLRDGVKAQIDRSNLITQGILHNRPIKEVESKADIEFVEELYDNDLISKGDKEQLESRETPEGEPKFNGNKVKPFLKMVAQQSNNLNEKGEVNKSDDTRGAAKKQYPQPLIDAANEAFPDYKKLGDEQGEFEAALKTELPEEEISKPIELSPELPEGYELPEQPTRESEVNIPTNEKTISAASESVEPITSKEIPSSETTPPEIGEPPTGEEKISAEAGDEGMRLNHADTEAIYKELGLPERMGTPTKHLEQLQQEANSKLEKGYDFNKVADEVMNGNRQFEDVDQLLFAQRVAGLKAKQEGMDIKSPEFDAIQNEIEKLSRASDVAGTITGRALQSRKSFVPKDESLADYVMREKEINQNAPLTDQQKETVQKEFNDISAAEKAYQEKIAGLEAENARLKADKVVKGTKRSGEKKDYAAERKEIFASIQEKLKKVRQDTSVTILPYAKELVAIAPDVAKLVKNLVEQGVSKLEDVVDNIHEIIKDDIKGLTKKDVQDLIAGEYNEKKQTRNEISEKLYDLRTQAQLINKLEKLESGIEPKNEKQRIRRNQEIEGLRKQIKEHDLTKLSEYKSRANSQIKKLEEDLRTGNFEKPEKKEPLKLDKEAIELKDKLVKLRQEREIRILQRDYANRNKYQKATDQFLEVLNVPRTVMSSMDYSAPLRQGLIASISHPRTAALAGIEMFKQSLSQSRFDRWFYDLRNSEAYKLMEESGLYISDPHDPKLSAKEEAFMNNLAEKIPFIGKLIKGSERAYVGYLNKMRVDLFKRFSERFAEQGKTIENSQELYKQTADYINNSTGRGKLGKLEDAAPILNTLLFSPRLIASRVNLLFKPLTPSFYTKTPKEIRVMYAKDMFKFLASGLTVLALAKLNGAQVEDDPRSTDFGKIRQGDTRWDIWGGFQPYVRVMAQVASGEKKQTTTDEIKKLNGEGAFGEDRGDVISRFMRSKLAPVPGAIWNLAKGRDVVGNPVTPKSQAIQMLTPLIVNDIYSAWDDKGVRSLFEIGIPAAFGVSTSTYGKKQQSNSPQIQRPSLPKIPRPKMEKIN